MITITLHHKKRGEIREVQKNKKKIYDLYKEYKMN